MSERSSGARARPPASPPPREVPPADIADFIRFCHHRRPAGWPDLYDEMCAVAARREFHGWGREQLADHGLALTLREMPRVAAWVRSVIDTTPEVNTRVRLEAAPA